jgi:hippurate hydrolase
VIPAAATLDLSVRALDRDVRALLERRIRDLAEAQAQSFGVQADVAWRRGYAVLVNTPAETAFARAVALELLGDERVTLQGPPLTGSEDFAFMLERVPGAYVLIGNGNAPGHCMVHHPGYDFNDDNIAVGSAFWVRLAERFLVRD